MNILVLGLGNDLLTDDAAGILAARALLPQLDGKADVVESNSSGVALLDFFIGYDKAVIIDAIHTGKHSPGTLIELTPSDLDAVISPSAHYAGIPELLALANRLELDFPEEIVILAIEVLDPYTIGGNLTEEVKEGIDELVKRVIEQIHTWQEKTGDGP